MGGLPKITQTNKDIWHLLNTVSGTSLLPFTLTQTVLCQNMQYLFSDFSEEISKVKYIHLISEM